MSVRRQTLSVSLSSERPTTTPARMWDALARGARLWRVRTDLEPVWSAQLPGAADGGSDNVLRRVGAGCRRRCRRPGRCRCRASPQLFQDILPHLVAVSLQNRLHYFPPCVTHGVTLFKQVLVEHRFDLS